MTDDSIILKYQRLRDAERTRAESNGQESSPNGHVDVKSEELRAYAVAALIDETEKLAGQTPGGRNDLLNIVACKLGGHVASGGINDDEVHDAMVDACTRNGLIADDGMSSVIATLRSGLKKGKTEPKYPQGERRHTPPPEVTVLDASTLEDVQDFWEKRDVLGYIRDFARSRMASPWAVLGVVMTRALTIISPAYVLPPLTGGEVALNMFVGLVGESGAGKDAAIAAGRDAIDFGELTEEGLGSGEGLVDSFVKPSKDHPNGEQYCDAVLFTVGEVDTLVALGGRRNATLMPMLREAYNGSKLGFTYRDKDKRLSVPRLSYRLGLIVGIQPGRAGPLLDDAVAGTPQRFTWLPVTDPQAPDDTPPTPARWEWRSPAPRRSSGFADPTPTGRTWVELCALAERAVRASRREGLRGNRPGLESHATLNHEKTAIALAVIDGRLELNEQDWRLAATVQRVSDATRQVCADAVDEHFKRSNRAQAQREADRIEVIEDRRSEQAERVLRNTLRLLVEAKDWVPWRILLQKTKHSSRRYLRQALNDLVETGQVEVEESEQGGLRYRAC